MPTTLTPYLSFRGNTREAFAFYAQALGAEIQAMLRFADMPAPPAGDDGCAGGPPPGADGAGDIGRRSNEDQRQRNLQLVEATLQGQSVHARKIQLQDQTPGLNAIMAFEEGFGTFEGERRQAMRLKLANQSTAAIGVAVHHTD